MAKGEGIMPTPYGTISTSEGPVNPEETTSEPVQEVQTEEENTSVRESALSEEATGQSE